MYDGRGGGEAKGRAAWAGGSGTQRSKVGPAGNTLRGYLTVSNQLLQLLQSYDAQWPYELMNVQMFQSVHKPIWRTKTNVTIDQNKGHDTQDTLSWQQLLHL